MIISKRYIYNTLLEGTSEHTTDDWINVASHLISHKELGIPPSDGLIQTRFNLAFWSQIIFDPRTETDPKQRVAQEMFYYLQGELLSELGHLISLVRHDSREAALKKLHQIIDKIEET